ncbi:hypothetical protein GH5_02714 [Leishmania sp. Ghana 2012 LV757]|uniref:hypothetical protein n=1 Tax=Leishmania sp. Ghana 2012 LV757 TaxID=2803181 RepID=UPI001B4EFA5A|nr:hypothetical protein GH5_02714 [Leishmania sp. Ghana 2012 LV757]
METIEASGDGAHLFIAIDVAGVIHCYRYTAEAGSGADADDDERASILQHLWSRRLDDQDGLMESATTDEGGAYSPVLSTAAVEQVQRETRVGFRCTVSKRLCCLQPTSTVPPLSVAARKVIAGNRSRVPSAPLKPCSFGGQRSSSSCDAGVVDDANTQDIGEGSSDGGSPAAGGQHPKRHAAGAPCPFCTWAHSSSLSPSTASIPPHLPSALVAPCTSAAAATRTTTNANESATSPLHRGSTVDRAAVERSEGHEETSGGSCGTGGPSKNLFRPCDFMARIPEAVCSVLNASVAARLTAATGSITFADPASPAVGCVPNQHVEAAWYWRCPRSVLDSHAAPDGDCSKAKCSTHIHFANRSETNHRSLDDTEKEATDPEEDSATGHLWMSLSEAVRRWNTICCPHHRLLLLRHMEERYSELDLFTGASLTSVYLTPETVSAAAVATLDSASSSNNLAHSIRSSIVDGNGTESGDDCFDSISDTISDVAPRAVLSLTTQLYRTLVMQGSTPHFSTEATKKKMPRKTTKTASRRKAAHTCLAKLTAPAVQLALSWHAPRQWVCQNLSFSGDGEETREERHQGEVELLAASQGPAARSFSTSSESTLLRNSTSASDIDGDVLAGRKQLPPRYNFVRAVSPVPLASVSSATSPRRDSDTPVKLSTEKAARQTCAGTQRSAEPSAGVEGLPHEIPVRCGPGGCVYGVMPAASDSFTTNATSEGAAPQFLLLLQLPLPIVEAFWVTLPSSYALWGSQCSGGAAHRCRPGERPLSATELRRVPWLPREACSLRAAELSVGASMSTSTALAASPGDASASAALTTMRGFVLEVSEAPSSPNAISSGFPRVLRALSAYDVLSARSAAGHSARRRRDTGENGKPLSVLRAAGKREQAAGATAAPEHRRGTRDTRNRNSSTSSLSEDRRNSSIIHSISPPPRSYIPSTSFLDENFEPLMLLGRGVSGAVLLVRHRVTGVFYAIKVLVARDYESERDILQEMRVHAMLENRYVVRYHTCWSEVISATRAQQLAFIGVCRPHEANLTCRTRLESPSSLSSPEVARRRGRSGTWQAGPTSDKDIPSGSKLRCAPGAWHHLMLPSYSSMYLVGSDSISGTPSPKAAQVRSRPRLRSNGWGTAIADKFAVDVTGEEGGEVLADSVRRRHDVASDRIRYSRTGMASPPKMGSQCSPGPLTLSPSSSSVCDTHAPLASHRLLRRPFIASFVSSGSSSAASGGIGGINVEGAGDSEEEETLSMWDNAQGGDNRSSSSESSGDSGGSSSSRRQRGRTIIGKRVVFLQMELCQGTLAQYLASRASIHRVENLIIIIQVVAGLRYLHRRGILHRDLKPTNVFMDYRCQYDKAVCQTNSSDTSGVDDGAEHNDTTASSWVFLASPTSQCSAAAAWSSKGSDEAGAPPSPSALALCRRHSGTPTRELQPSCCGPSMPCAPRRTSIAPPGMQSLFPATHSSRASGWEAGKTKSLLESLPSWDNDQTALDFVRHTPHRVAAEMLQERLLRRPPPPVARQRACSRGDLVEGKTASSTASMSLVRGSDGRHFLHRLANWLLHRFVQVRLGDFGLAKFLYQQELCVDGFVSMNGVNTIGVGSPLYASPEQLQGNRCTPASDAFSVGVVLAEMYLQPKTVAERLTVLREVREGVYRDTVLLGQFPELKLVRRLTVTKPERRMTLAAAHSALKSFLEQALQDEVCCYYE